VALARVSNYSAIYRKLYDMAILVHMCMFPYTPMTMSQAFHVYSYSIMM